MRLSTSDYTKTVDVGTGTNWYSLYSTVLFRLSEEFKGKIPDALDFLKNAECSGANAQKVAEQMDLIRAALMKIAPTEAILDYKNPELPVPWKGHISKEVESCAGLYTTADGKNLLLEVIDLLKEAKKSKTDILTE